MQAPIFCPNFVKLNYSLNFENKSEIFKSAMTASCDFTWILILWVQ